MKSIKCLIITLCAVMCLASCQDNQKKAENLAEKYVKENLYVPDSYEAISTTLDTAYYNPYIDKNILQSVKKILDKEKEIEEMQGDIDLEKMTMSINEDWGSSYSRNCYNEAKEKYDAAVAKVDKAKTIIEREIESIKAEANGIPKGKVVGWGITHKYRADTQAGLTDIGQMAIIASQDFNEILFAVDYNDKQYAACAEKLKEILEGE